jgi:hyaluronoglucosaminidase
MIDDDPDSYYSTARAPAAGELVQVDLGAVRRFGEVAVLQATPASPDDYLRDGILEYSPDGSAWRELATGTGPEVRASAPDGARARYLRYRARAGNGDNWLAVREFQVRVLDR